MCDKIGVRTRLLVAQASAIDFGARSSRRLIVVRAKMNLSVSTPILCVLLVALLSEMAYARPAEPWFLRYIYTSSLLQRLPSHDPLVDVVRPPLVFPARLLKLAPFDATSLLFFFPPYIIHSTSFVVLRHHVCTLRLVHLRPFLPM